MRDADRQQRKRDDCWFTAGTQREDFPIIEIKKDFARNIYIDV